MIDHIDILKDGASAVYGSDAVTGVVNFFLLHKFRGLEIGGSYGNTNLGASNDMGEWEAWIKAGTGDDKTDIVVVPIFGNAPVGFLAMTATFLPTPSSFHLADLMRAAGISPAASAACASYRSYFSVQTRRLRTRLRTRQLLRFTKAPLPLI